MLEGEKECVIQIGEHTGLFADLAGLITQYLDVDDILWKAKLSSMFHRLVSERWITLDLLIHSDSLNMAASDIDKHHGIVQDKGLLIGSARILILGYDHTMACFQFVCESTLNLAIRYLPYAKIHLLRDLPEGSFPAC